MNVLFHRFVMDGVFTEAPGGALAIHPTQAPDCPFPALASSGNDMPIARYMAVAVS